MDHAMGPGGLPVMISGEGEIAQRLLIRLSVPKGSFSPDKSLGSELYKLPYDSVSDRERLALHRASEALRPEGALIKSAKLLEVNGALTLKLNLEVKAKSYSLEVKIC